MADICLYSSLVPPPRTPAHKLIFRPSGGDSDATGSSQLCLRWLTRSVGGRLVHSCLLSPTCKRSAAFSKEGFLNGSTLKACRPSPCCPQGPHGPPCLKACMLCLRATVFPVLATGAEASISP